MPLYKTIPVPDRGVNFAVKPHALDPRAWFRMEQFRTKNGTVTSFPGWESVLTGAPMTSFGTMIREIREVSGTRHLVVADDSKVYELTVATGMLTDITGAATIGPTMDEPWMHTAFANNLYFTNLNDGLYKWNLTGNIVNVPEAPKARSVSTLNDFLCLLHTDDGTIHPHRFHWATEGTDDDWIAAQNNDAGDFDLLDSPGFGVALYRLGNDVIAYKEKSIVPLTFIGGNEVFGRRASVGGVGLIGQYALINFTDKHMFMGQEAFYNYSGGNIADDTIGDAIRDAVFGELHEVYRNRTRALYLREHLEAFFAYCDVNATGGIPNRAVIYNMKDGTWYGPFNIPPFVSMTGSYEAFRNNHQLDMFATAVGNIYQFNQGMDDDNDGPLTRELESGDHNVQTDATDEGGNRLFFPLSTVFQVNILNIDLDNVDAASDAEIYVAGRLDLNDPIVWQGPFPIESFSTQTIRVPVRVTGRWFRIKIVTTASVAFTVLGYQFAEFERVGNR